MARSFVTLVGVPGIAIALAALAAGNLSAEPLPIDSLQSATATPAAQAQPEQIPEIAEAVAKLRERDMAGAHAVLQGAVKKRPELKPAAVIMADLLASAREGDAARSWLEKAVIEAPNDPEAYILLGVDAMQSQRMVEASLLLNKANELLASFNGDAKRKENLQTTTSAQLALVARNNKDWAAAQKHLDLLLKVQPNNHASLHLLGRVLFEQKKVAEALEKLKAAKMANPNLPTAEALLGSFYEEAGDHASAGKQIQAALKAQPKDFATRMLAANWAFTSKDFKQAREQADAAVQLKPESLDAKRLAGTIAIFQKDYPAAEKFLKAVLADSPGDFAASNNLALALSEQDDKAKQRLAAQYAQLNVKLNPKDAEALSTFGRTMFRLGQLNESDQIFRQAASISDRLSPDTAFYIAALYAETERKDEAKKLLNSALKATGLFAQRAEAEALLKQLGP